MGLDGLNSLADGGRCVLESFQPLVKVDTTLADGVERFIRHAPCYHFVVEVVIAHVAGSAMRVRDHHNLLYAQFIDVATATLCWIDTEPKTEGIESGVAQVKANAVLIQSHDGTVSVEGVADGTDITIYDTSGQMVGSTKAHCNYTTIATNLRNGSVAIVRIGDKSFKIIMK